LENPTTRLRAGTQTDSRVQKPVTRINFLITTTASKRQSQGQEQEPENQSQRQDTVRKNPVHTQGQELKIASQIGLQNKIAVF